MNKEKAYEQMKAELPEISNSGERVNVEDELFKILQEAIWEEIEAETGMSQKDYDEQIIAELRRIQAENEKGVEND